MAGEFNNTIHAPKRLQICAILRQVNEIEFRRLADELAVSDSVLSKHLKTLDDAGLLVTRKRYIQGRPRNWIALNGTGRRAFDQHITALKAMVTDL